MHKAGVEALGAQPSSAVPLTSPPGSLQRSDVSSLRTLLLIPRSAFVGSAPLISFCLPILSTALLFIYLYKSVQHFLPFELIPLLISPFSLHASCHPVFFVERDP